MDGRLGNNRIPPEVFAALDTDDDGELSEAEIPEVAFQEYSFDDVDQDNSGALSLEEIMNAQSPSAPIWNVQVRARGAETPDGVFAWLDQDHDYMLSTREIQFAARRLGTIAKSNGIITPANIPDTFLIQFVRGDPQQDDQHFSIASSRKDRHASWPIWALSMDTNGDGDISADEFPGTRQQFIALDGNDDGFVERDEISRFSGHPDD